MAGHGGAGRDVALLGVAAWRGVAWRGVWCGRGTNKEQVVGTERGWGPHPRIEGFRVWRLVFGSVWCGAALCCVVVLWCCAVLCCAVLWCVVVVAVDVARVIVVVAVVVVVVAVFAECFRFWQNRCCWKTVFFKCFERRALLLEV